MQNYGKPQDGAPSATSAAVPGPAPCDYRMDSCLPYLRSLEKYLEIYQPDLHTYVHKRYIVHLISQL